MRIVLMGAPGAGKGTQARMITREYAIPHISTGEMFRQAVREDTPVGRLVKAFLDEGSLVPDEVTVSLVRERLQEPDCRCRYMLDGFPRNLFQARALEGITVEMGAPLQAVINIDVPQSVLVERATGRRVCVCGLTYHLTHNPPRIEGECDVCGCTLSQRDDDTPDVVAARLETYVRQTEPLKQYYCEKRLLYEVDGSQDVASVGQQIRKVLEAL